MTTYSIINVLFNFSFLKFLTSPLDADLSTVHTCFVILGFLFIPGIILEYIEVKKNKKKNFFKEPPSLYSFLLVLVSLFFYVTSIRYLASSNILNFLFFSFMGLTTLVWSFSMFLSRNDMKIADISLLHERKVLVFIFSLITFYFTLVTYSELNSLFGIDQSKMPFSIIISNAMYIHFSLLIFLMISMVFLIVYVPSVYSISRFLANKSRFKTLGKEELRECFRVNFKIKAFYFSVYTLCSLVFTLFLFTFVNREERLDFLALVAYEVDFNGNYFCDGNKDDESYKVIFMTPDNSVVYAVRKYEITIRSADRRLGKIVKCFEL